MSSQITSIQIERKREYYHQMTIRELKQIASECNIRGRSKMVKYELVNALVDNWVNTCQQLCIPVLRREKTLYICRGLTIQGENLVKCQNKSDKQHCPDHEHRYRFEKPDDCPVCMDTISIKTETPLECGHWIHKNCLSPTNLHICPVCRQTMKPHEVTYIFGENHQQRNQYSQNYYQPFANESLFSQIIIQNSNGDRVIDIYSDYNNQEHFFNEVQSEYLFEDENHNGLEFHNDFDEHEDNFYHDEQILSQENEEIPSLIHVDNEEQQSDDRQEIENAFTNMSNELIEMIIHEIEIRPRFNPYVTLPNVISEIPDTLRENFINFVSRTIHNFGVYNNFNIDEIMIDEIRAQLFSSENDHNLLKIYFNLTFIPHMEVNFLMRIQTLIHDRILTIHDSLTFNF